MSFPDVHADQRPDRIAYIVGEHVVTYRELVDSSIRIANLLRVYGVQAGDVVAFLLPNRPGIFEVSWACQRSGLRYVAVSTHLNAADIAYIIQDSGTAVLFTCADLAALAQDALARVNRKVMTFSLDGGGVLTDARPLIRAQPAEPTGEEREGTDLLYSSGTTGRPKGIIADLPLPPLGTPPGVAPWLAATWGFDDETVYLSPAPLYHAGPMRFCHTVHRFGGTVVVMERFDARHALELMQRHSVTHTQMVPTMLVRLLQLDDAERSSYDLSSLRAVIHAAAPCPPTVKRQMIEWLGPIVDEYYSCTENIVLTVIKSSDALTHPGSVGRAVVGTVHILDDGGQEVPTGTVGTIWAEGGFDFTYLNDPDKTASSRNERGWRTAGDVGCMDSEGYLYLSDRRSDLIIAGGVNIYPQEAENVLIDHPSVLDVAVFGVPDPELGERVTGVVQLAAGVEASEQLEQELLAWCHDRLSKFKCPRNITFTEALPRTPTGKLLRRVLRERETEGSRTRR